MVEIKLKELTQNRVRSLSGQERGVSARSHFRIDELDGSNEPVVIHVPDDVDSLSPSFLQGMFSVSIKALGPDLFRAHYVFDARPAILEQVDRAITNTLVDRRNPLN